MSKEQFAGYTLEDIRRYFHESPRPEPFRAVEELCDAYTRLEERLRNQPAWVWEAEKRVAEAVAMEEKMESLAEEHLKRTWVAETQLAQAEQRLREQADHFWRLEAAKTRIDPLAVEIQIASLTKRVEALEAQHHKVPEYRDALASERWEPRDPSVHP